MLFQKEVGGHSSGILRRRGVWGIYSVMPRITIDDAALLHKFGLTSELLRVQLALKNAGAERKSDVGLISGLLEGTRHISIQQTFIDLSGKGSYKW